MKRQIVWALIIQLLLPASLLAGSRGVSLAFLDATPDTRSKASLRLAELLEKDMRGLYLDPQIATAFPWSEQDLKLQTIRAREAGISFDRLLNTENRKKIATLFEKAGSPDGLIVFYHDAEGGFARLKLYNQDGEELLLIRLPLEGKDSAMPGSLLKGHRHGALIALGAAVRWTP